MEEATLRLINSGILGPVTVILIWAVIGLQRQLTAVQTQRVKDAQEIVDRLLGLQKSIDANTTAVNELRRDVISFTPTRTFLRPPAPPSSEEPLP